MADLRDLYKAGQTVRLEMLDWGGQIVRAQTLTVLGVRDNRMLTGAKAGEYANVLGEPELLIHDTRHAFWDAAWYSGGPKLRPGAMLDKHAQVMHHQFEIGLPPEFSPNVVQVLALGLPVYVNANLELEEPNWDLFYAAKFKHDYPWWLEGNVRGAMMQLNGLIERRVWPFGVVKPLARPPIAPVSRQSATSQLPDVSIPATRIP